MVKTKLNIPATLVHSVKGTLYKINGILLSINESNDTCTMKFDDNYVSSNIPMSKVLINEGFLDKIKEYGKKVASYITLKVKGFVALVDEATNTIMPWSLNNVANLAVKAAHGDMPEGVFFAPSNTLKSLSGVDGMSIDEAFAESEANDRRDIVNYWKRVMHRAGTTEGESIEESIKYVNETYYRPCKLLKSLNEAVYSYDNVKDAKGFGQYGVAVHSKQLKAKLKTNIRNQISGPLGGHADVVPFLIWGAPGIGKTAIIKSTIKEMANSKFSPVNLSLEVIMLAGYTIENWTLPHDVTQEIQGIELKRFKDVPKAWLPVYVDTSDPQEKIKRDMFMNSCKFMSDDPNGEITSEDNRPYEGGIVFMDEYSRVMPNVQNIIMGLGNDHKFGDNYVVASKWGFVFASNRAIDENEADSDDRRYFPTAAQTNRFKHFTYVPDKKEWIDWARKVDGLTGEAPVPPFIVDFIEASPDHVWYATVVNGGYDDMLENPEADKRAHETESGSSDAILDVLSQEALLKSKRMVTPRTWANTIGPEYRLELKKIFNGNTEGLSGEEYYQKLVKQSVIEKKDEDGNSYKDYYGDILPNILVDALNEVDDEFWDEWVEENGGLETLDPTNTFNGIRARYNIFMAWFLELVRDSIGDDSGTNASNATGPVITAWRSFQSYAKQFTPNVLQYIWEHGCMPKEYQADDDKKPISLDKFADTEFSKWKQFSNICFEVAGTLFEAYPGDLEDDVLEDIKTMAAAQQLTDAEVAAEAKKLVDDYSFKINNKKVSLLFDAKELADMETLRGKVQTLLNSKVARLYANFAKWIAKVAIQAENGHLASDYETKIYDSLHEIDSALSDKFTNKKAILAANTACKKDPRNKQLRRDLDIAESIVPVLPAVTMLHRATTFDFENSRKK